MLSSLAPRARPSLIHTPTHRELAIRRRLAIGCALAALALISGVIGALTAHAPPRQPAGAATGPFSYFPTF